jgi:hypothetical protein
MEDPAGEVLVEAKNSNGLMKLRISNVTNAVLIFNGRNSTHAEKTYGETDVFVGIVRVREDLYR